MPIIEDLLEGKPHALHSLDPQGAVDGGYIFSTSNCIYTGMCLSR